MTDWPGMLRTAALMGVAPAAFWRLSLVEWRALTGGSGGEPLGRAGLEALLARFPDEVR